MNILDPQGPIAAADKTILIDSIAIMLVIVLPTIAAIFMFAFWFRQSNPRAVYRPDWAHSGRIELVVWSIPALTIILGALGAIVARIFFISQKGNSFRAELCRLGFIACAAGRGWRRKLPQKWL